MTSILFKTRSKLKRLECLDPVSPWAVQVSAVKSFHTKTKMNLELFYFRAHAYVILFLLIPEDISHCRIYRRERERHLCFGSS